MKAPDSRPAAKTVKKASKPSKTTQSLAVKAPRKSTSKKSAETSGSVHVEKECATPSKRLKKDKGMVPSPSPLPDLQKQIEELRTQLSRTQSDLHQQTQEKEYVSTELHLLKTTRDEDINAFQVRMVKLQEQLDKRRKDMAELHAKISEDTEQWSSEVAALTKQLMAREDTLNAERAQRVTQMAALKNETDASTAKSQGEQTTAASLATENTVLLQQSRKGHDLAGRVSDALHAIIEGNILRRNILSRLADQRKARLLQDLGLFDAKWYAGFYADVREQGVDPTLHFIRCGYSEGRAPCAEMAELRNGKTPEGPLDT